jgi:hypothetical protein
LTFDLLAIRRLVENPREQISCPFDVALLCSPSWAFRKPDGEDKYERRKYDLTSYLLFVVRVNRFGDSV